MRLFAALVPPPHVVEHLDGMVVTVRDDALRWADVASWHITLAFYGELDADVVPGLRDRLIRAARRCPPLSLRLSGAGRFGKAVLWVGTVGAIETRFSVEVGDVLTEARFSVEVGDEMTEARFSAEGDDVLTEARFSAEAADAHAVALRGLAASASAAGRRVGVPPDRHRGFRPHVTLARSNGQHDLRPYVEAIKRYHGPQWSAPEMALIESRPGTGPGRRPEYTTIATFPLGGVR